MHEFSIAMSILDAVQAEASKAGATSVTSVTLNIGTMAGIEFEAMDTALLAMKPGTFMENTEVMVNKIQAVARCADCEKEFEIHDFLDPCPVCGGIFHDVIAGKELKIKSIVVEV